MDFADVWNGRTVKLMKASEYANLRAKRNCTLYCPLCGEEIYYASGKNKTPHFRHLQSNIAELCQDYIVDYTFDDALLQISEHVYGEKPSYLLLKEDGVHICFGYVALTLSQELSQFLLTTLKTENYTVIINTSDDEEIGTFTTSNINLDEPLISVDRVASSDYCLSIITPQFSFKYRVAGFNPRGTLFQISSSKSQRLPYNATVRVGKYYYLLIHSNRRNKLLSILDIRNEYPVVSDKPGEWIVCEVAFKKISPRAFQYSREILNVRLIDDAALHIPLWPPMVQVESFDQTANKISTHYLNEHQEVFCAIPERPFRKSIVTQYSQLKHEETYHIPQSEDMQDTYLAVDASKHAFQYLIPSITAQWNEKPLSINGEINLPLPSENREFCIGIDTKCDVSYIRNGNLIEILPDKNHLNFLELEDNDEISLHHGLDCVASISFTRKFCRKSGKISDEELYTRLTRKEGGIIPFPAKLKYLMPMFENYPKTYLKLKMIMKSGKIGKTTAEFLEEIVCKKSELL